MPIGPEKALPLPAGFDDVDSYVDSLLHFGTSSWLLQTLCGGVHILDFFTRDPDIYSQILPQDWRDWFEKQEDIMPILDLLMRDDLGVHLQSASGCDGGENVKTCWQGGPPPASLVEYIADVRRHLLDRRFEPLQAPPPTKPDVRMHKHGITLQIAVGMKDKKVHEVDNFARYVDRLTADIAASKSRNITHLVDFGSGQNYLGRALASEPYNKHLIAVESKPHNIEGSKIKDMRAQRSRKPVVIVNKKAHRTERYGLNARNGYKKGETPKPLREGLAESASPITEPTPNVAPEHAKMYKEASDRGQSATDLTRGPVRAKLDIPQEGKGTTQYVAHRIEDGDLSVVIDQIVDTDQLPDATKDMSSLAITDSILAETKAQEPNLMTISLHSCGNLLHHGLRTLTLNPKVSAVCMIGCCYNLVTERLSPPSYKLPSLRSNHPRLISTSNARDPHGFPMSTRLATYKMPPLDLPKHILTNPAMTDGIDDISSLPRGEGINLNITARMMAVQAPQNWGPADSDAFFTRHFYRALLQRIFLDLDLIPAPIPTAYTMCFSKDTPAHDRASQNRPPRSPAGSGSGGDPIIIGTLKKAAYASFVSYVRAAGEKLAGTLTAYDHHSAPNPAIATGLAALTDEAILDYERRYAHRKRQLSVVWSLMAYSAGVVEAIMVVDRWAWLREQECVGEAWVVPVFDYALSPRNLCVVGVKK
ncbi:hypothetical protein EJ05DRAFT_489721 [Pseudovirgaria hyperparasitica]|uniref:Methyltransferase domain-containing protein n=1 Tax=Pseudovirgaria hyperparasitica TaxID=470096 RepID=A0A6A6VV22_9PEZI|nr:uncharacterized protein EJ05DRAFT_489721 [Pseudovirgaria hyperparasitica]KAF2754015.1 hypothetical protein EJ05DRAFT_489721 [Pseudovirgaria hyperparasitica]